MGLKDDANELKGIFSDLNSKLDETLTKSDLSEGLNKSKDSIFSIVDAAQQLVDHQNKQNSLTSSQLKDLQKKVEIEQKSLQSTLDTLQAQKQQNQRLREANHEEIKKIKGKKKSQNLTQLETKEIKKLIKENKDLLDIQGGQTATIERVGKLLGENADEVDDLTKNLKDSAKEQEKIEKNSGEFAKTMKKGFNNIFDGPTAGVMNMLNPLKFVADLIGGLIGATTEYDKRLGDTAKSMNLTYTEAEKSNQAMARFTQSTNNTIISAKDLNKTVTELNKTLGTSVKFEEMGAALQEDVSLMAQLEQGAGLTAEETQGIMKYSMGTGKAAKDVTKQIMAGYKVRGLENKLMLNEKDAMKEIAKTSKATQLSISGGAEGLGKALASAKALGTNLDKVDGIAGSLLNFEESIANELEAELLTGKELNLEKARQAAMDGELGDLADEIAKNIGTAADFTKMNRIQQEAVAKAVGMTREELAGSLMEQEALKAVSADSVDDAYAMLQSKETEAEKQAYLNQLGNESLEKQLQQRSIAEEKEDLDNRANQSLVELGLNMTAVRKTMQDVMGIVHKILKAFGGMKGILTIIGGIMIAKVAKGMYGFLDGAKQGYAAVKTLAKASKAEGIASIVSGAWKTFGGLPLVGAALAAGAAAVGIGYLTSQMSTADDMFSPGGGGGGYGNRTLMGPEGAIALNNKDDVIAGTDLFKGNDVSSEGGGSTKMGGKGTMSVGPDMSSVVAAINALGAKVEAMANRPINVGMDGKKVVEASTGNNPNTFGEEVGKNSFALQ